MLNESLFLLSFDQIKNLLLHELTIFHVAIVYVLMYVIYKAFGRYIYFKPQEHASKVNRTFLALSVFIILIHSLNGVTIYLPFLPEYRWLFVLGALIILIAPFSIIMHWAMWEYNEYGGKSRRRWTYDYLPLPRDYYKTSVSKSVSTHNGSDNWEEEGVESTSNNFHSDALLNLFSLIIFIFISIKWAKISAITYGWSSYWFSMPLFLFIVLIFLDESIFSWIKYVDPKIRRFLKHKLFKK